MIKCVVKLGFVSNHLHSCTLALSLFACPASTLVISSTRTPAKGPSFLPSALEEKLRRDKTTEAFSRLRIIKSRRWSPPLEIQNAVTAVTIKVVENPFIALSSSIHQESLDLTFQNTASYSMILWCSACHTTLA